MKSQNVERAGTFGFCNCPAQTSPLGPAWACPPEQLHWTEKPTVVASRRAGRTSILYSWKHDGPFANRNDGQH